MIPNICGKYILSYSFSGEKFIDTIINNVKDSRWINEFMYKFREVRPRSYKLLPIKGDIIKKLCINPGIISIALWVNTISDEIGISGVVVTNTT